jgi:glycine cleavage system aminomethyltransferase T
MPAATPALAHSPLEPQLQKAGATMVARHGWWVAAHFGSPAGELALCETAVGMADRSDLGKLELQGEAGALEQLVGQLSGGSVSSGDALLAQGAWWCAVSPTHVLALSDAGETDRVRTAALDAVRWTPGATVIDLTPRLAAIGLFGPRTADVLTELSDSEPPREDSDEAAFDVLRLAAVPALVLRGAGGGRAVVLTEAARVAGLWMEIERAGREAGIGHVGADAVSHLSPLAR